MYWPTGQLDFKIFFLPCICDRMLVIKINLYLVQLNQIHIKFNWCLTSYKIHQIILPYPLLCSVFKSSYYCQVVQSDLHVFSVFDNLVDYEMAGKEP